jgi:hypothetical protein
LEEADIGKIAGIVEPPVTVRTAAVRSDVAGPVAASDADHQQYGQTTDVAAEQGTTERSGNFAGAAARLPLRGFPYEQGK